MTGTRRIWAQLAIIAITASGALMGAGAAAQADPPPGWEPGEYGLRPTSATQWVHQGRYADAPGNFHTGWVNVEEDDDVLTGSLADWWCPAGVTPPLYGIDGTECKLKGSTWIEYIQYWDVAKFNYTRDRLSLHGDWPTIDIDGNATGTVRIDLTFQGLGEPDETIDESGEFLGYSEYFNDARATGKVDGHSVGGSRTTQYGGSIGYYLDGWVRSD